MSRILIIEDEEAIADLEKDYLELSGFDVEIETRGDRGLTTALQKEFDLIILDLMLPGIDGFDVCRKIREKKDIPILMVSAKKDDIDKIRGLGLGADDYMTKPFSPSELVARVKAHMARYQRLVGAGQKTNDVVEIRGLKIDKTATGSKNADSSPKTMSLGKFLNDYNYNEHSDYVPAGAYYFTSDASDHDENHGFGAKIPYVMVLKGGSNYRFWFKGGVTFGLYNVIFIVDKPDKAAPVLFLMEDGANINWPGDGSGTSTNGKTGGNGILAVEGRNFDTKQKAYDFVTGITAGTARQFENSSNKYSTRYDGKNEPCAMVLGMGNNKFCIDKNIIMEAFIGLFNDSYGDSPKSTLSFRNNDAGVLYGRIMTDGLGFSNDSGSILYPASPAASTLPAPNPDMEKVVTCFSLKSMIYYYGLGNKTNP